MSSGRRSSSTHRLGITLPDSTQSGDVLWVTNVASPYRRPVWEYIGEHTVLTVGLVEPGEHTAADGRRHSDWQPTNGHHYSISELSTVRVTKGENARFALVGARGIPWPLPANVVITGWDQPAYWQLLLLAKVLRRRVVGFYESTLRTNRFRRGPVAVARRWFFHQLDAVVVPGIAATDAVLDMGVPEERIHQGFNAVDVLYFNREARALGGVAPTPRKYAFCYVGQLIARKNVATLIKALGSIDEGRLLIVGSGPEEANLRNAVARFGLGDRVDFRAPVPNAQLPEVLVDVETLVLPSTEEVWGLVVNEALAMGLQTVVSDQAGVAQSVAGWEGVFVVSPTCQGLEIGLRQAHNAWRGPIADPSILSCTPEAFGAVFIDSLKPSSR